MGDSKRKQPPGGGSQASSKKSKRGNEGKWQTPHHKNNLSHLLRMGTTIEAGDVGIWVTCQRGLEKKAMAEMTRVCEELGESMYGIKPRSSEAEKAAEEDSDSRGEIDISDAVAAELEEMKAEAKKQGGLRLPPRATRSPVDPVAFVDAICDGAAECGGGMVDRKLRHVNRLTPVVTIGKALDRGIEKVGREVLGRFFELVAEEGAAEVERADIPPCTFAIRQSIRASAMKRDELINRVAALVGPKHKVKLESPDKVILVDIFKNHCGMSVVDGPRWEKMKKFNINEIYKFAGEKGGEKGGKKGGQEKVDEKVSEKVDEKDGKEGDEKAAGEGGKNGASEEQ
ncbi:related to P.falciparum dihydropteroate synthase [Cephalotrichum gorgonifer]|uniref:Related to P.falciparum dihydropteroate synthase n=1 Tax=Cephalotrichum gorgonifer TaxID=2041049 RepID=A0AAE8MY10_9PEZI|nr:related to P.falciparum dihydropteroate synthase [Cephalotrichum gorgonifer]